MIKTLIDIARLSLANNSTGTLVLLFFRESCRSILFYDRMFNTTSVSNWYSSELAKRFIEIINYYFHGAISVDIRASPFSFDEEVVNSHIFHARCPTNELFDICNLNTSQLFLPRCPNDKWSPLFLPSKSYTFSFFSLSRGTRHATE